MQNCTIDHTLKTLFWTTHAKRTKMTWKITCKGAWRWKSITLLWKFLQKSAIFHNLSSFVRTPPSVTSLLASLLILSTSNSHHQMTQGFQETNVKMPSNNNERKGFSLGPPYQMGRVYLDFSGNGVLYVCGYVCPSSLQRLSKTLLRGFADLYNHTYSESYSKIMREHK